MGNGPTLQEPSCIGVRALYMDDSKNAPPNFCPKIDRSSGDSPPPPEESKQAASANSRFESPCFVFA